MRTIGPDIHRVLVGAAALEGASPGRLGRIGMTRDHPAAFAATLSRSDHVVVEATAVMELHAPRIAVTDPPRVHLIARGKTDTSEIDAGVPARRHASGLLPEVRVPDEAALARRRQATRRTQLVRQRGRPKSIPHAHLIPRCDTRTSSGTRATPGCARSTCRTTSAGRSGGTSASAIGSPRPRRAASATSPAPRWAIRT